jgi:MFS family permease
MTLSSARQALACLFLLSGGAVGAWMPFVPVIAQRMGLAERDVGIFFGAVALGAGLSMSGAGRWLTRFNRLAAAAAGGALFLFFLPLPFLAASFPALLAIALTLGAAYGLLDVSMNVGAALLEREAGTPLMSSMHGFFALGTFGGAGLSSIVLAAVAAPPLTMMAAVSALLGLLLGPALREMRGARLIGEATRPASDRQPQAGIPAVAALAGLAMLMEGAVENWMVVFLNGEGYAPAEAARRFTLYAGGFAAARLAGDRLIRRFGRRRIFTASGSLATLGLMIGLRDPAEAAVTAVGFAVAGLGLANIVPMLFSAAGRMYGGDPAAGIARIAMVGYGGLLLGPPLIGAAAHLFGLPQTLAALSGVGILCALAGRGAWFEAGESCASP